MRRMILMLTVAAVVAVVMVMSAVSAFAVGGPNEAGNSGHFQNNSAPCGGGNPFCPPFGG